jgi:hypothetical protein
MAGETKRVRRVILQVEFPRESRGEALKAALERLAVKNFRSTSSEACVAIQKHLTESGMWPPEAERKAKS